MNILMTIYIIGGLILIIISIPLILRRVPPNRLYGFRVQWTKDDPELWYSVNAYTGKWLVVVGLFAIFGAVGLSLIPGLSLAVYAFSCLGILAVSFTLALLQSIRFLRNRDSQK